MRTPERYVSLVGADSTPTAGEEVLDDGVRRFEGLALALRTPTGVPAGALPADPALDGLVRWVDDRAVLTVRGRLLADAVTAYLRDPDRGPARGSHEAGTLPPDA